MKVMAERMPMLIHFLRAVQLSGLVGSLGPSKSIILGSCGRTSRMVVPALPPAFSTSLSPSWVAVSMGLRTTLEWLSSPEGAKSETADPSDVAEDGRCDELDSVL